MIEMNRGIREHRWRGSRGERRKKVCVMFDAKEKGQRNKKNKLRKRPKREFTHQGGPR